MKRWKIWVGLGTIFLSGLIIGAVGAGFLVRGRIEKMMSRAPEEATHATMRTLTRNLSLSARQQEAVEPLLLKFHTDITTSRRAALESVIQSAHVLAAGMEPLLDPLQRDRLRKLETRLETRLNKLLPPLPAKTPRPETTKSATQ